MYELRGVMCTQVYDDNVMNTAKKNELSEYMRVRSNFYIFILILDCRIIFRPNNTFGCVTDSLGGLLVIEHVIWMLCVLFYFIGFS